MPNSQSPRSSRRNAGRFVVGVIALALAACFAFVGVSSLMSDATTSEDNRFQAGYLEISDNDSAEAMYEVSNMQAGAVEERCITLENTGSIDIDTLRLYAPPGVPGPGGDAGDFIEMTVERGSGVTDPFSGCAGFTAASEVYNGLLDDMPETLVDGIDYLSDIPPAGTVTYRFTAELLGDQDAQNKGLSDISFIWHATGVQG